jgi:Fe-S-cluster containining protein
VVAVRRGCGGCCQRLADVPQLTRAEWLVLREGIEALQPELRAAVLDRISALEEIAGNGEVPRHVTCPMLDTSGERGEGTCLVYALARPRAARSSLSP